ncbi:hypothetical protein [Pseudomonas sp. NPDC089401]|uniref:hypothetical protein n=1 Tax=Pseudomonas sp. NPDC089401 TaxID=3364462 RepID=UPI00381FF996
MPAKIPELRPNRSDPARDIRSEINDLSDASVLLGHSKEGITERVYRRVGAFAKPSKG